MRAHTLRGVAGNIGATAVEQAAHELEAALARAAATPPLGAGWPPLLAALETALNETMAGLDDYFLTARVPGAGRRAAETDADAAASATPAEALARLQSLLADFSGDSNDYFDGARTALATLLAPAALERLAAHMAQYEFEAARAMLAAAAQELDPV